MAYQRLGEIQASTGHVSQAIEAFQEALNISQNHRDTSLIIPQMQSIGTLQVSQAQKEGKSLQSGINRLLEAKKLASTQTVYQLYLPAITSNLGLAHARMGDCETAVVFFEEGVQEYYRNIPTTTPNLIGIMENYGRCLVKLGKMGEATYWAERALSSARKLKNPRASLGAYGLMVEVHETNKNFEQALFYEKESSVLAEMLRNQAREEEIKSIQKDFEIRKRELELKEARAQQRKSQYGFYALLAGIIALGLASFMVIQLLRKDQRVREEKLVRQAEGEKQLLLDKLRNKELQSYAAAIEGQEMERRRIAAELHDGVGGTMAALKMTFSSLLRKIPQDSSQFKSYSQAMQLLDSAVKEVRQLSHQMAARQLLHEDLKHAVVELIEVLSQKDNFIIQADLSALDQDIDLNPEQKLNVYRLIQEHFQNTLKHAQATRVDLSILRRHQILYIEFKDNGKGFDYQEGEVLPGLGLQNIDKRVKQLGGRWSLQSAKRKGLRSIIEIPLHREFKGI